MMFLDVFFFFKQKTAYEMRISDWSSDVCSSDLLTVSIKESPTVVQPAPFSRGQTAIEPSSEIEATEDYRPAFLMKPTASLAELVDAINRMGVPPGDLVAILEALSQAGALTAELVII